MAQAVEWTVEQKKRWQYYQHSKRWTISEQRYSILYNGLFHIPMALSLIHLGSTQGRFHLFINLFYMISSISFNIAMMLPVRRLYLHSTTWKKVRIQSGLSLFNLSIIYLMEWTNPKWRHFLEYAQYGLIMIIQESDPERYQWNWNPILFHLVLFIVYKIYSMFKSHQFPCWSLQYLVMALLMFGCGYWCLFQIKEDYTFDSRTESADYLQFYHSLSDLFIGIGFHCFWRIVPESKDTTIRVVKQQ